MGIYNQNNNYSGPTLAAQNDVGMVNGQPTTLEQQTSGTLANGQPTLASQEALGSIGGNPTLQNLLQQANIAAQNAGLTGTFNGNPTLAAQQSLGFINGSPTLQEQTLQSQIVQNALNAIMNAPKGPADAFSYLSKLRGINSLGPLASLMRGSISGGGNASLPFLQSIPTLSNTQLATDLMSGMMGGQMSPLTQQYLARTMGVAPTAMGQGSTAGGTASGVPLYDAQGHMTGYQQGNGDISGTPTPSATGSTPTPSSGGGSGANGVMNSLVSALYNSVPTHLVNGSLAPSQFNTGGLPTGFQTSQQAFNNMAPGLQQSRLDLSAATGGENQQDFLAGMAAAAPEFAKAGNAGIGATAPF